MKKNVPGLFAPGYYRYCFLASALLLITFIAISCKATTEHCKAINLKTEYLVNPLGLDTPAPRFTWQLADLREGASQTACRIVVGTDSAEVAGGNGNIWNTARVKSDRILAVYDGPNLQPFTRYFWSVELWDKNGKRSLSPATAWFETGMMDPSNWKGHWITDFRNIKGLQYIEVSADIPTSGWGYHWANGVDWKIMPGIDV